MYAINNEYSVLWRREKWGERKRETDRQRKEKKGRDDGGAG